MALGHQREGKGPRRPLNMRLAAARPGALSQVFDGLKQDHEPSLG